MSRTRLICAKCGYVQIYCQCEKENVESTIKPKLLQKLQELGYSNIGIERALELPFGTIELWTKDPTTFTEECVALVKFLIIISLVNGGC